MATHPTSIVVGIFRQESQASRAIDDLKAAGFAYDQIGVARHEGKVVPQNLLNDLMGLGIPQERAHYYENEFNSGGTIISVRPDGRNNDVTNILQRYGAYDYGKNTGAGNSTQTNAQAADDANTDETRSLRLREEQLQATKQRVQAGEVELRKDVVTEQKSIIVPVTHEEVVIERRNVSSGQVDLTPIGQDETIRIPVSEEQVKITKTPVVTSEVAIGKRAIQENQQVTDTVKREEARLENPDNAVIHGAENDIYHRNQNNPDTV